MPPRIQHDFDAQPLCEVPIRLSLRNCLQSPASLRLETNVQQGPTHRDSGKRTVWSAVIMPHSIQTALHWFACLVGAVSLGRRAPVKWHPVTCHCQAGFDMSRPTVSLHCCPLLCNWCLKPAGCISSLHGCSMCLGSVLVNARITSTGIVVSRLFVFGVRWAQHMWALR